MSKTYTDILAKIESLKAEAEKLRRKETDEVIARIREAITHYGLTAADLGLGAEARAPRAGKSAVFARKSKGEVGAPKFRDEAGNTWGGRGPRPAWLRAALAAGKSLQDFAV